MAKRRKKIGMIASDVCKEKHGPGRTKNWFHLRKFIETYKEVLDDYQIMATDGTADIITETVAQLRKSNKRVKELDVKRLGRTYRGVVKLAAKVARGEIDRVLCFEDPKDLETDHPQNYALMRNCNLRGAKLCLNEAARLWAEYEKGKKTPKKRKRVRAKGTVAFIAHDGEKQRMADFVIEYHKPLKRFSALTGTSGTAKYINKRFKAAKPGKGSFRIDPVASATKQGHGPTGGDVIIADKIYDAYKKDPKLDSPFHILFFIDHKSAHAHEADIHVLLRTCVDPLMCVNLILNSKMAEEWIQRYKT